MTASLEEILKVTAVSPSLLARLSVKGKVVLGVEQALPMRVMPRAGIPCRARLFDWVCGFIESSSCRSCTDLEFLIQLLRVERCLS
jgi:hypothetical protein